MTLFRNFEKYKEEIELAKEQNGCVEIELYSIIANLIRGSKNKCELSLRDVSNRRKTDISKPFYGDSGFPDFVVLEREKKADSKIYGCIEVKMPTIDLDKDEEQVKGHINYFKKLIYTNGIRWIFIGFGEKESIDITIGEINKDTGAIEWKEENKWDKLLKTIDAIEWYKQNFANKQIEKFWSLFCKNHKLAVETPYEAWGFGDGDMADELGYLVNKGIKTATTSAYELYEKGEKIPQVGDYNIILDSKGNPICVIQIKLVSICPYNLISPEHAWHEGEGDRSYSYWRKVHDEFFEKEYQKVGKAFYEQAPMLCEVFEKIE